MSFRSIAGVGNDLVEYHGVVAGVSNPLVVTFPTGTAVDDIVYIWCLTNVLTSASGNGWTDGLPNTPSGWTRDGSLMYRKKMVAGDISTGSVTFTWPAAKGKVLAGFAVTFIPQAGATFVTETPSMSGAGYPKTATWAALSGLASDTYDELHWAAGETTDATQTNNDPAPTGIDSTLRLSFPFDEGGLATHVFTKTREGEFWVATRQFTGTGVAAEVWSKGNVPPTWAYLGADGKYFAGAPEAALPGAGGSFASSPFTGRWVAHDLPYTITRDLLK